MDENVDCIKISNLVGYLTDLIDKYGDKLVMIDGHKVSDIDDFILVSRDSNYLKIEADF